MKYVLIGNSFASTFAAETIRSQDHGGEILIIGDEKHRLYSRALIHEYLAGMVDEDRLSLRNEGHHENLDIKLLTGKKATELDPDKQKILVGNETISYDKLFLGLGGTPFIPPGIEGLDDFQYSTSTFLQIADADRIKGMIDKSENIVVLGAGLIGMQAADAISHCGKNVVVVELADHLLPMAVDEQASAIIRNEMEKQGINFKTSNSIEELIGTEGKLQNVRLKSGEIIPADAFIIAVGVRPNVNWLAESGITIDRGIVVDKYMQTNLPNIYSAGDCAQGFEMISESRMVIATIPIAAEQGTVAGYNMAGVQAEYRGGIPMNALQFGDLQIISFGYVKEHENQEVMSLLDAKNRIYKKIILEDNKITGALLLRAIDRAGIFRYLIEEKIDVSEFKHNLLSDNFGPASLPAMLRKKMFTARQSRIVLS